MLVMKQHAYIVVKIIIYSPSIGSGTSSMLHRMEVYLKKETQDV